MYLQHYVAFFEDSVDFAIHWFEFWLLSASLIFNDVDCLNHCALYIF